MLIRDLKFGFRMLLRKPLLTIGISLSLALGIGANSAVFSLVDAVLFRPLNVGNPARLVSVYTSDYSGSQYSASSYADFIDFRDKANVFESVAAFTEMSTTLRSENHADRTFGLLVSANYFDLLGVKAAHGRTFRAEEDQTSGTVVVTHSFWQRQFGGDPALVGKTVLLNNNSFTVIGITPEGFTGTDLGRSLEIFVPMQMSAQLGFEPGFTTSRNVRQFSIMGRLKPGVSETQADASLNLLARQFADAYPDSWKERNQQPRRISVIAEHYARVPPEARSILMGLAGLFTVLVGARVVDCVQQHFEHAVGARKCTAKRDGSSQSSRRKPKPANQAAIDGESATISDWQHSRNSAGARLHQVVDCDVSPAVSDFASYRHRDQSARDSFNARHRVAHRSDIRVSACAACEQKRSVVSDER